MLDTMLRAGPGGGGAGTIIVSDPTLNSNDMSMRERSLMKREINKQHNSNFKAGYVPINEPHLHRTGLRGRKSILFYLLVVLLFLIALLNLAVTLLMLNVLQIGYGMHSLEFIPNGFLLKFLQKADLGHIIITDGIVGSFLGDDLTIVGHNQAVRLVASGEDSEHLATLNISPEGTTASNLKEFRVVSRTTGRQIFSTKYPDFKLPQNTSHLNVQQVQTKRVRSALNSSLLIESEYQIILKGNEGTRMSGKEITWTANQDINLKSVNQSIIFDGKKGVHISVDKIPLITQPQISNPYWYRICVCMPSGRIFKVKVTHNGYNCGDLRKSHGKNPCI